MSAWRGAAIGAGVVAVLSGILLGTGVISVRNREETAARVADVSAAASAAEGDAADDKKRRRRGKGKRGKRGNDDGEDLGKTGVVMIDKEKVFDGLTLMNPCFRPGTKGREKPLQEAELWDIEGKRVHEWAVEVFDKKAGWAIARLDDEGYLYVIMPDVGLAKLDWDSNVVWKIEDVFHHDLAFDNNGDLVALLEQKRQVPRPAGDEGDEVGILDQGVAFIGRDGEVKRKLWFYDTLAEHPVFVEHFKQRIEDKERKRGDDEEIAGIDMFHSTGVAVLRRNVEKLGKQGDILVSARHLDLLASLSRDTGKLIWSWGADELQHQHDPTITDDGKVVVFDNGLKRRRSRVLFVDPKTNEIVRTYDGGEDEFFSAGRGIAQVLPNGNLLVFISNDARIVEVTPEDKIVWEFNGPFIHKNHRLPIRGARLVGPTLDKVRQIVDGKAPPPKSTSVPAGDEEE